MLCDYPEVFKLDGNKLFCNKPAIMGQKFPLCGGLIDYDEGFNYLVCTQCGKQYTARELSKAVENKLIILKGDFDMDVQLVRGNEVIVDGRDYGTATIAPPKKIRRSKEISASIVRQGEVEQNDEASEVTKQIAQLAMENSGDIKSVMDAIRQVAEQRVNAQQPIVTTTQEVADTSADDETSTVEPIVNEPDKSSEESSGDTKLPEVEQVGNRVKPAPPIMDQY